MDRILCVEEPSVLVRGFFGIPYYQTNRVPIPRYGQWYHGQMALQIGVLVAFTQLIPEHQVQLFGVLKTRVKVCVYLASRLSIDVDASASDAANGIPRIVDGTMHYRFPMPVDRNPVWLASQLGLAAFLQEKCRYHGRHAHVW